MNNIAEDKLKEDFAFSYFDNIDDALIEGLLLSDYLF